jgi:predicted Fe-Mo cluster-binding NifX family protein
MKVAFTTSGEGLDAAVDARFGRAPRFLIIDTETRGWSLLDNKQNVRASQGAGIQASTTVIQAGAEAVVTGNCGPRAFDVLTRAGLRVYTGASGTIADALEALEAGRLGPADGASVDSHAGMGL